jgi:hypothetical protein
MGFKMQELFLKFLMNFERITVSKGFAGLHVPPGQ